MIEEIFMKCGVLPIWSWNIIEKNFTVFNKNRYGDLIAFVIGEIPN